MAALPHLAQGGSLLWVCDVLREDGGPTDHGTDHMKSLLVSPDAAGKHDSHCRVRVMGVLPVHPEQEDGLSGTLGKPCIFLEGLPFKVYTATVTYPGGLRLLHHPGIIPEEDPVLALNQAHWCWCDRDGLWHGKGRGGRMRSCLNWPH